MSNELITYISTYGDKCINAGSGIPLEVGAANRSGFLYTTRDDTGDNISQSNEYYGDLTALYWIWKNGDLKKHRFVSFRHYNKYLCIKETTAIGYLQANKNGWIVAKEEDNPPHNYKSEWDAFREIIKNKYPFYYSELLKTYDQADGSGHKCNTTNMFITSTKQMDEYCEVLFKMCKDLRETIGDTNHTRYDQRYCAFMAERFLTVYINAHACSKLEVDVCRGKRYLHSLTLLAKALGVNKNSPFIKRIEVQMSKRSYKSSYLK